MGTNATENDSGRWIDTIKFDHGSIRDMLLKKRPKEKRAAMIKEKIANGAIVTGKTSNLLSVYKKYQIIVLIGTHSIVTSELSSRGKVRIIRETEAPGRIIRYKDDSRFNLGMLLLLDNSVKTMDYSFTRGCSLFNFPFSINEASPTMLYSLKMEKFHELINSSESDSVAFDSYFEVLQANRHTFEKGTNLLAGAGAD